MVEVDVCGTVNPSDRLACILQHVNHKQSMCQPGACSGAGFKARLLPVLKLCKSADICAEVCESHVKHKRSNREKGK